MRVLLVEDDSKAARLLAWGFEEEGFAVDAVATAEDCSSRLARDQYDLIVVDWMLPGKDGRSLCSDLRRQGVQAPILMLTARDALEDRIAGFNAGADDYLTKPFAFEELLARTHALLRRSGTTRRPQLVVADLVLNPDGQQASRNGRELNLTRRDFAILQLLVRQSGQVVTRAQLALQIWKTKRLGIDNLIDAHIRNLRRKVDTPGAIPLIRTMRGRGFRIAPPLDADE
jgi:DNA-binding response OmpR family regulator